MPSVEYKGSLSERKRKAVHVFVNKVNQKVELPGQSRAIAGPEGQVVVICSPARGVATERSIRKIMSTASQEILDSHGVWVVGIAQKASVVKAASVVGARMHPTKSR
jgi:hypothetical protein